MLLGITKKHHDLLEQQCHSIDKEVAESLARSGRHTDTDSVFTQYVNKIKDIHKQEEEVRQLETQLVFNEPNSDAEPLADFQRNQQTFRDKLHELEDELEEMRNNLELPLLSGPVTKHLDRVLLERKICKQAYHSKAFIGNHCHKYMQPDTITSLCNSIVKKTEELVEESDIKIKATQTSQKFQTLNTLYSNIHAIISHSRPVTDDDINTLDNNIKLYMSFYRREFPHVRITPKQHLLESHCIPFIRQHGFGLALHGEQGGEQIHAVVNRLERRMVGVRNREAQLRLILTEQLATVSPTLQAIIPLETATSKHNK